MKFKSSWIRFITLSIMACCFFLLVGLMSCSTDKGTDDNNNNNSNIGTDSVYQVDHYDGTLRLYIVEPVSRWKDIKDSLYSFGFLDFALDSAVSITDSTPLNLQINWDGGAAGWSNITEDNIMVIAVLFGNDPHQAYAYPDPPNGNPQFPFQAYYVDATAAAEPGITDSNQTTESMSHTVFVEEATTTTCVNCPTTRHWLHETYNEGHNFYYAAMVYDKNVKASTRINNDYNCNISPVSFFDGGNQVLAGGWSPALPYINEINAAGIRAVPDIDLVISTMWVGTAQVRIDVSVTLGK